MRTLVKRNLDGRKILLLFFLTNILYIVMLTITIPLVMRFSGGMKLLDMKPSGYNPAYVDSLLSALGDKGRSAYLFRQLPLDMIYPGLFAITYCLLLAFILKKLHKLDGHLFYLCLLPVFSGVFDYCENIGIIIMLKMYPDHPNWIANSTSLFSVLKSSFTTVYFVTLIVFVIVLGINKFKSRSKSFK
jgi:hypothetical protein